LNNFVIVDEFRKVKTLGHYESIGSVGGSKNSDINQPSTSGKKQSPVKSASFAGVLVSNKQVCNYCSFLDVFE